VTELLFPDAPHRGAARGVLARWLVVDGSRVRSGQRLAEVHMAGEWADAGEQWVSALATGTLWHQAEAGEVLFSGAVVGLIE
jgi:hypothetical protein